MKKTTLSIIFMVTFFQVAATPELPKGWRIGGTNPDGYSIAVVYNEGSHPPVAMIKSEEHANDHQFVTVLQNFYPQLFIGKRLKMTVDIKTVDIGAWAGAWLRVDDRHATTIAFDNMYKRPITGNNDWQTYAIVIDIPHNAASLTYGVLLSGSGQVWFDDFTFEVVSKEIEVTDMIATRQLPNSPINNSF